MRETLGAPKFSTTKVLTGSTSSARSTHSGEIDEPLSDCVALMSTIDGPASIHNVHLKTV